MSENILDRLVRENYTTEEVAQAVGRTAEHWCRIRYKFIARYKLVVVKVGRRYYYKKKQVDQMIDDLLKNGEQRTESEKGQ